MKCIHSMTVLVFWLPLNYIKIVCVCVCVCMCVRARAPSRYIYTMLLLCLGRFRSPLWMRLWGLWNTMSALLICTRLCCCRIQDLSIIGFVIGTQHVVFHTLLFFSRRSACSLRAEYQFLLWTKHGTKWQENCVL